MLSIRLWSLRHFARLVSALVVGGSAAMLLTACQVADSRKGTETPQGTAAEPTAAPWLAQKYICSACHDEDKKLIGPAYMDVAKKYKGDKSAEDKLSAKVKNGGGGVWGTIPMPPNNVPDADLKVLVEWILSLSPSPAARISMGVLPETESALGIAQTQVRNGERRYILLDFYAAWCPDSNRMSSLFSDPKIQDLLKEKFGYVRVDVGDRKFNQNTALTKKYNINALSTIVILGSDGTVIDKKVFEPVTNPPKTGGPMDAEKLWKYLSGFH